MLCFLILIWVLIECNFINKHIVELFTSTKTKQQLIWSTKAMSQGVTITFVNDL